MSRNSAAITLTSSPLQNLVIGLFKIFSLSANVVCSLRESIQVHLLVWILANCMRHWHSTPEEDSGLVKLVVMTNIFFNNQQHEINIKLFICVKQITSSFFSNNWNQRSIHSTCKTLKPALQQTKGYVTCKFSTRGEIHPGVNSTLPMVKVLFVVTCWN